MQNPDKIKLTITSPNENVAEVVESDIEILKKGYQEIFSREKPEFFIEKGGAGAVYELPGGFCIKFFFDRHNSPYSEHMDLGNTPEKEASLLERMSNSTFVGNVRVPRYLGTFEKNGGIIKNALLMERLNADNLQHILASKSLPENFNPDSFLEELEKFIQHMHSEDKIVHNDLFPRNVMVDRETGSPRVIDFGRSIDTTYIAETSTQKELEEADWVRFDEICEAIYALQKE